MEIRKLYKLALRNLSKGIAVLFISSLFIVVLDTELKGKVRSFLLPQYRVILAVATSSSLAPKKELQIIKVKTQDGLFLEIYEPKEDPRFGVQPSLVTSIKLPDKKDGYFTFNGRVTNLAIDDIDGDKVPEILTTSFDNDLVARLNVYRYQASSHELSLVHLN